MTQSAAIPAADRTVTSKDNAPPDGPPLDEILLEEYLQEQEATLVKRAKDLQESVERMPTECADDKTEEKLTTFGGMLLKCATAMEHAHKKHKDPYWSAGKTVDTFFNPTITKLRAIAKKTATVVEIHRAKKRSEDARLAAIAKAKSDQETKERADEAARLEKEAADLRKAQEEAEQKIKDAADAESAKAAQIEADNLKAQADKVAAQAEKKFDSAVKMENRGDKFEALAASGGKAGVTRTDSGTSGRDQKEWVAIVDPETLDAQALYAGGFIDADAIQKAANRVKAQHIANLKVDPKAQAPEIRGITLRQETSTVFR